MTTVLALLAVIVLAMLAVSAAVAREQRAQGCETSAPAASFAEPLDIVAILWAIRQVETGDNPRARGVHGERGAYQFMPDTWKRHAPARANIVLAEDPVWADRVARSYLNEIMRELARRELPAAPAYIAAGWQYGPRWAPLPVKSNYAQRVTNLYRDAVEKKAQR